MNLKITFTVIFWYIFDISRFEEFERCIAIGCQPKYAYEAALKI